MTLEALVAKAKDLRLIWLQTFLSAAAYGTLEAAAEELGIHATNVRDRIENLERSLGIALLETSPRVGLMKDGDDFVTVALSVIKIFDDFRCGSPHQYHTNYLSGVGSLTVSDLHIFCVVCSSRSRKDAQHHLGISISTISRVISKVESSLNIGSLFTGRSFVAITPEGERVHIAFSKVLQTLSEFRGTISTKFVTAPPQDEVLRRHALNLRRRVKQKMLFELSNFDALQKSKKGKALVEKKRSEILVEINRTLSMLEDLNEIIGDDDKFFDFGIFE